MNRARRISVVFLDVRCVQSINSFLLGVVAAECSMTGSAQALLDSVDVSVGKYAVSSHRDLRLEDVYQGLCFVERTIIAEP